ncbi:MAG TPA: hypothetical protein VFY12_07430 [Arenimonas sp.]|nr:hypothetical protein [Arenimonas sp.]
MTFRLHRLFAYRPCKPRNPLLKVLVALLGLSLLLVLVTFGLVIGLGMLCFAAARRLLASRPAASARQDGVIDGEYSLVDKHGARLGLH